MRVRPDIPVGQEKTHLSYGLLKGWRQMRSQGPRVWLRAWWQSVRQGKRTHDDQP
jgi:hypothetical protein